MKNIKEVLTVKGVNYLNCSIYGNPKKRLILEDAAGHIFTATTATNALLGYYSYYINNKYNFNYHYTKTGNIIVDYVEDLKQ